MSLCNFPNLSFSLPSLSFSLNLPSLPTFSISFSLFCPLD